MIDGVAESELLRDISRTYGSPPEHTGLVEYDAGVSYARLEGPEREIAWALLTAKAASDIRAIRALQRRPDEPRLVPFLDALAQQVDPVSIVGVQLAATRWALGDAGAGQSVLAALASDDVAVVRLALDGLRDAREPRALGEADRLLDHPDPVVRGNAFSALFRMLRLTQADLPSQSFSTEYKKIMSSFPSFLAESREQMRPIFARAAEKLGLKEA